MNLSRGQFFKSLVGIAGVFGITKAVKAKEVVVDVGITPCRTFYKHKWIEYKTANYINHYSKQYYYVSLKLQLKLARMEALAHGSDNK